MKDNVSLSQRRNIFKNELLVKLVSFLSQMMSTPYDDIKSSEAYLSTKIANMGGKCLNMSLVSIINCTVIWITLGDFVLIVAWLGYAFTAYVLFYHGKLVGKYAGIFLCFFNAVIIGASMKCEINFKVNSINTLLMMTPIAKMYFLNQSFLNWKYKTLIIFFTKIFLLLCNIIRFGKF
jgi:hypothetical protein